MLNHHDKKKPDDPRWFLCVNGVWVPVYSSMEGHLLGPIPAPWLITTEVSVQAGFRESQLRAG